MVEGSPKKNSYEWRLGEILIQEGMISWKQLQKALHIQQKSNQVIGDILVEKGYVSREQGNVFYLGEIMIQHGWLEWKDLKSALEIQKTTGRLLGEVLLEKKYVSERNLYHALAIQNNMAFVTFDQISIPNTVLQMVPKEVAFDLQFMPLLMNNEFFLIAISDPNDFRPESELRKLIPNRQIRAGIASPNDINQALKKYYGPR